MAGTHGNAKEEGQRHGNAKEMKEKGQRESELGAGMWPKRENTSGTGCLVAECVDNVGMQE